jgi:hypothetical protein
MGIETPLGTAVSARRSGRPDQPPPRLRRSAEALGAKAEGSSPTFSAVEDALKGVLVAIAILCSTAGSAVAGERFAVVITGATGGPQYAKQYDAWRTSFVNLLRDSWNYPDDHVFVLAETESEGVTQATRENVRRVLADLRTKTAKDDVVLVLLIGHGASADSDEAKFNLVGPDLSVAEWADLLKPIPARLVFVDTASGSFPFLERLSARGRIVITADESAAQQFETVFPGFFIKAFNDDSADLDKRGRVSLWEAFVYASDGVRRWFEEKNQLATERALLDDNGDGIGREADGTGTDGLLAQVTYVQPDRPIIETGDTELTGLMRRRADLENELEALRARKPTMDPDEYETALEKILIEIAQIDRRVRSKS